MNSRLIGTTEHIWYKLGQLSSNNFTMLACISGKVEEQKLRNSLKAVAASQVMLRARVINKGKKLYLNVKDSIEPELTVIDREDGESWKAIVEEELKNEIQADSFPLWRFTWIKGDKEHELLMTFNHLLSDGRSGVNFFKMLLKKLDKPEAELRANSLFPSYEKLLKRTHGVLSSIKHKFSAFKDFKNSKKHEWFQLRACHQKDGATRIESRTVSPEFLKKLLSKCRENDVSASTYLSALMSEVFSEKTSKCNSLSLAGYEAVFKKRSSK